MIAAYAAAATIRPEPHDVRMLVTGDGGIVAVTPDGAQQRLNSDNVASLLIRLTWRNGTPSGTTLRTCSRERC